MTKGAKWKTLLVTLISCLLITAIFYPITIPVDMVMEGVELRQDGTSSPVTLRIQGDFDWRIFGSDQMDLNVYPEGSQLTNFAVVWVTDALKTGLKSSNAGGNGFTMIGEFQPTPIMAKTELVFLYPTKVDEKDMSENMLSWDKENGSCFVVPAQDKESALRLLKQYAPEAYDIFASSAS